MGLQTQEIAEALNEDAEPLAGVGVLRIQGVIWRCTRCTIDGFVNPWHLSCFLRGGLVHCTCSAPVCN